jgi:integrase
MTKNNVAGKPKNNLPPGIRMKGSTYSCRVNVKNSDGIWKNIEKAGFSTVKEAVEARILLKAEHLLNPSLVDRKECNLTLTEVYQEFISKEATYDREKSTLKRYDSLHRNHIEPKLGKKKIKSIKPQEISDYLFEMTQTHAYAYIMSVHKFIKVLFKYAIDRGYMLNNTVDSVKTPLQGVEEGTIKTYTQAQLDAFEKRFASTNLLSAFKLGRALGVRCGECFGLLWSDVSWDKHTIKINKQLVYEDKMWTLRNTKTPSSIREIELQDSIYEYLKELKVMQEQQKAEMRVAYHETRVAIDKGRNKPKEYETNLDFINIKPDGSLLTPDSEKILGRIARDELGCNFKFHNLRHSHASWLAEHNVPIVVTKARLGHSKEETTNRYYIHLTQGMRQNLLNTLNSI